MKPYLLTLLFPVFLNAQITHLYNSAGIHTCALNAKNDLYCWGGNEGGQLGLGHKNPSKVPVLIGDSSAIGSVSRHHTCFVQVNGQLKCWGGNRFGQLGLGTNSLNVGALSTETVDKLPAVKLGVSDSKIKQVALGLNHTCALFDNGRIKCWGGNKFGELGVGSSVETIGKDPATMGEALPYIDLGKDRKVLELALGNSFSCARLENGDVKCWGKYESLGTGAKKDLGKISAEMGDALKPIALDAPAVQISTGQRFTCALLNTGQIKCWGANEGGVLGNGEPDFIVIGGKKDTVIIGDEPGEMEKLKEVSLGGTPVEKMTCGHSHCCAILHNRGLKCWGGNSEGQLGLGDVQNRGVDLTAMGKDLPYVNLGPFSQVMQVGLGSTHTCAVLQDSKVRCWGRNTFGSLGIESNEITSIGTSPEEMGESLPIVGVPE